MRSKEVEEAIKYLKELNPVKYWEMPERIGPDKIIMKKDETLQNVMDTVLNYIAEKEKENINWKGKYHLLSRKIDVTPNSVIRDKIKEIESNGIWVTEDYYFNEELGDEYPICQTKFDKEEMEDIVKDILKEILGE